MDRHSRLTEIWFNGKSGVSGELPMKTLLDCFSNLFALSVVLEGVVGSCCAAILECPSGAGTWMFVSLCDISKKEEEEEECQERFDNTFA
jgi:hypothetical protein